MNGENRSLNYSGIVPGDPMSASEELLLSRHEHPETIRNLPYSACLIDRSGRQFVCFHDHCVGYNNCFKNEFLDEIFDFQAMHFHPDDKACLTSKILPDIMKFMESIAATELADYRFSLNHRYIRKNGIISQFLQEGTFSMSDDNLFPVLKLRIFAEIGDFKTDETMILSIFRYTSDMGYQKVNTKVYGINDNSQLSNREIEIIKLCLEGLSSKMIADRLNLSIHTVKNHKRNSMEKTLTHSITELIHLCMKSRWL